MSAAAHCAATTAHRMSATACLPATVHGVPAATGMATAAAGVPATAASVSAAARMSATTAVTTASAVLLRERGRGGQGDDRQAQRRKSDCQFTEIHRKIPLGSD
jgi:hypothetical protein